MYAAFAREGGARRRRAGASCGRERPAGVPTRGAGRGVRMRDVELVSGALDRRGAGPTSPAPTDAETHGELRRAGEVTGAWARAGGDKVGAGVRDAGGVPRMGVGEEAAIWTPSAQSGPPAQASGDVDRCSTSAGRSPRVRGVSAAGTEASMMAKAEKVAMALPMASFSWPTRAECETSCPPGSVRRTLWAQRTPSGHRGDRAEARQTGAHANFIL